MGFTLRRILQAVLLFLTLCPWCLRITVESSPMFSPLRTILMGKRRPAFFSAIPCSIARRRKLRRITRFFAILCRRGLLSTISHRIPSIWFVAPEDVVQSPRLLKGWSCAAHLAHSKSRQGGTYSEKPRFSECEAWPFFQIIPYGSVTFETILCSGHPLHTNFDASRTYSYRLS